MRILVAHNVGRSRNGGMSRIMGFLHDEVDLAGHKTDYFCTEDVKMAPLHPSLQRFQFPLAVLAKVETAAKDGKPYDIVNVHEPSAAAVTMLRRASKKTKVVVTSHGVEERGWQLRLDPEATAEERPGLKSRILYPSSVLWQAAMSMRHSDHVFCLNEEDRSYILDRYNRNRSDVTRVFPAADPIYGRQAENRDYSRGRTFVFAASWLVRKGNRILVAAFEKVRAQMPDARLRILNPGQPEEAVLADFPAALRSSVDVIRAAPDQGTTTVLEGSDIFVLPSFFEGTPLTLMEALWSGLPVITTSVCGMKDVIVDGQNGLLVPERDVEALTGAMLRMAGSEDLRRTCGSRGYQDATRNYNWKRCAEPVLEAYERLVH